VGSDNDIQFEQSIRKYTGCEIHTFDPTVTEKEFIGHSVTSFHPWGLGKDGTHSHANHPSRGNFTWKAQSLESVVKKLKHTHRTIDILKIDCEGCEWEVMPDIFHSLGKGLIKIDQIEIELHKFLYNDQWQVIKEFTQQDILKLFQSADNANMRVFHKERNGWGCLGHTCVEYSLASSAFLREANKQIIC